MLRTFQMPLVYLLAVDKIIVRLTKDQPYMGLDVTNPLFGVSDKARLKPVSSATQTY